MMFFENPPPRLLPVFPDRSGPATLRYGLLTLLLLAVAAAGCRTFTGTAAQATARGTLR